MIRNNILLKLLLTLMLVTSFGGQSVWAQRVKPTIETSYNHEGHWHYLRFSHHGRYAKSNGVGNVITIPTSKVLDGTYWWQFVGTESDFVIVDYSGNYITWGNPYKITSNASQAAHFALDPHTGDANAWELKNIQLSGQVWMNPRTSNNNIQHWNDNDNGNKLIFDAVTEQEIWELSYTGPKWYTMKPNNGGYISSDYATAEGRMHVANSNGKPTTYAGVWRFYDTPGVDGQNLINAKYYGSRVLSVIGTDGGAVSKMDPVSSIRSGSRYKFEIASNGFVKVQNENLYLGNNSMQLCVRTTTNDGSLNLNLTRVPNLGNAVTIKCIDSDGDEVSDATIAYSCKREDISTKTVLLTHNDVYDFKDVPYMEYIFSDSPTCEIISKSYDEIHATLTFVVRKIKGAKWAFKITEGYTVDYNGLLEIHNGDSIILPETINKILLSVKDIDEKFVWGPVVDDNTKTVTYEVRDRVTSLTKGWYQMMLIDDLYTDIINNDIKNEEGNINTRSKTLYAMPTFYDGQASKMKFSGIPAYGGEASTLLQFKDVTANRVTIITAGGVNVGTFNYQFADGNLMLQSWIPQGTVHPLEGPLLNFSGNVYSMKFNVSAHDMSKYDVYQINFADDIDAIRTVKYTGTNNLGAGNISNGGYLFLPAGSNVPRAYQFEVGTGNGSINADGFTVGEKNSETGITPITLSIESAKEFWKVIINSFNDETYHAIYNGVTYDNGALIPVAPGTVISPTEIKTDCVNQFVWGPTIHKATNKNELNTVTFEIREAANNLTAGKWYQLQLSPNSTGAHYNPNGTGNHVEATLRMNPRNAGSQIYITGANKTSGWTVELMGKPADEPVTYLYVTYRSGNETRVMMQNGYYLDHQPQAQSSASNDITMSATGSNNEFLWDEHVFPWGGLNGITAALGKASGSTSSLKFFAHEVPVKAYKVTGIGINKVKYIGDATVVGSNEVKDGFFFLEEGQTLGSVSKDLFDCNYTINSVTLTNNGTFDVLTFSIDAPTYNKQIIHKQNRYYDFLETDANKPTDGFIQEGEGWNVRTGKNGETIREQNTSLFEIPVYLKQGTSIASYLPTNQLASYQRWYNWDTDGQVDTNVLISSLSGYTQYNNGYAYLNAAQRNGDNTAKGPTLKLPNTMEEYNVGLDISRMTDFQTNVSGTNGSAIEPSLGMRIVYKVRDAKMIARDIKEATDGDKFYEIHNIALPNVQYGSRASRLQDRTLSTTLPLDMDLNNYWGFNSGGTDNDNLVQLTEDAQLRVELVDGGSHIKNYMMIPGSASDASGKISRTSFNTGHFVLFQYPDNGYIEPNSTATINVYMTSGDKEYKLVQFNLTFIGNAHPIVVTELKNSYRHPDALTKEFGTPVTELTFDQTPNSEYSITENSISFPDYKYPVDYKGASYAFGARNNGRGWAASRGEYALTSMNGSSQSTGTPRVVYYPVTNYLQSMADPSFAFGPKAEGAYQLYIDAADQPGKIASIELKDALCAGSRLYCYGYIGCTSGGTGQNPTSVLINVMGINKDTHKEELIYSYCPGIITLRGYAEDGRTIYSTSMGNTSSFSTRPGGNNDNDYNYWAPWQQIGFSFSIGAEVAAKMSGYSIQIMNNAYNSNGGDTMLDDFQIYVKKPGAEVANTTPLCSDQIRHIKVITEYETLIEATGEDSNHDGMMNVGFCFLDKEVYDKALELYKDNVPENDEVLYARTSAENKYNKAFGEALMGNRTLDKSNKDHAFHNFDIIRDGEISTIDGVTKKRFYTDIPQYSFKESGDDVVYRDSIRGERYIVFKESVAHGEASGITNHKWTANKSYYLLFSTAAISEEHVNNHDLACTVFGLDDNKCAVLYEFTVAPPVSIKGDKSTVVSGDELRACAGQTASLAVNLNGRTDSKDVIIKNLNYDWWMSAPTHEVYKMEYGVPVRDTNGYRIALDSEGHEIANDAEGNPVDPSKVQTKAYNTVPATLQNYMNVWHGFYQQDNIHLDKHAGDKIYLSDALMEFRRAYPNAVDLINVEPGSTNPIKPLHQTGDTIEYELTQDMIDCIAHFLEPDENGYPPLLLMKKEMNLTLGTDYADVDGVVHFVVIPIAPGIYSVDEDAIYCPDPQELKVKLYDKAPEMLNGFNSKTYPSSMKKVPVRIGLSQIDAVRHAATGVQNTLKIPVRNINLAYPEVGKKLVKTSTHAKIYLVGTNDPAYRQVTTGSTAAGNSNWDPTEEDIDEMEMEVGDIANLEVTNTADDQYMNIIFDNSAHFREGYTYTLKVPFYEVKDDNSRDMACDGSFIFDMKVVPEYQIWTGAVSTDWTNDQNWLRADRSELLADNPATGNLIKDATPLATAAYPTNENNETNRSFVPMFFTNTLIDGNAQRMPALYSPTEEDGFPAFKPTATGAIQYDMLVKPTDMNALTGNQECELFNTNKARGITFEPNSEMLNAEMLEYKKAWVEYELKNRRWYTLSSPLQNTFAGEWYAPTDSGKQMTPHFHDINYEHSLNHRFKPAIYQRSWDSKGNNPVYLKTGAKQDAYIKADWSYVYNDVTKEYSEGGFSVKVEDEYMENKPSDGKTLLRMPKADLKYTYYDINNETGQKADDNLNVNTNRSRLWTDKLKTTDSFTQTIRNISEGNNFFLVGNPFMASMDMDTFFEKNPGLEKKFWIMTETGQSVSVKVEGSNWIGTASETVSPLQGFFVKGKTNSNEATIKFTADMQGNPAEDEEHQLRIKTRSGGNINTQIMLTARTEDNVSRAVIVLDENANASFKASEDCETLIESGTTELATIYTVASGQAMSVNCTPVNSMIPIGITCDNNGEAEVEFSGFDEILYLYDKEAESSTIITDGTTVKMPLGTSGRFFISTSDVMLEEAVANEEVEGPEYDVAGRPASRAIGKTIIIKDGNKVLVK